MCQPPASPLSCRDNSNQPYMFTHLIPKSPTPHHQPPAQAQQAHQTHLSLAIKESKSVAQIALPMMLTGLLLYSRSMISMLFLGNLGGLALAGGSLAVGFANITGYSILSGLAMGLEPICSQAFGAKKLTTLGVSLQRTILLLIFMNPKATVASMGILIQTTSLIYIFPSSLSFSVSTRVGNELGAGRPKKAKRAAMVGLCWSIMLGFSALVFAVMVRNLWATMFTHDREIIALTSLVLPIIGLCELGNCPQTTGCGVLRGTAQPKVGANINLGCFYLVGMPVAVGLGFVAALDFTGLWLGLLAAQSSCVVTMLVVLSRTDWEAQARRAKELTGGLIVEESDETEEDKPLKGETKEDSSCVFGDLV
ncbi:Protein DETOXIFICATION like [Actinidia chinensis var. chinensis]|uniref:Protein DETOXIFICATION like n=1 Tax=Actinidia chinensis var. chinensis TaxID=1590841 RepID=A0A2R6RQV4_ACTCC|nr:Protein DETOXIFICATION like [Actinidia chinensis var. chinensis]